MLNLYEWLFQLKIETGKINRRVLTFSTKLVILPFDFVVF